MAAANTAKVTWWWMRRGCGSVDVCSVVTDLSVRCSSPRSGTRLPDSGPSHRRCLWDSLCLARSLRQQDGGELRPSGHHQRHAAAEQLVDPLCAFFGWDECDDADVGMPAATADFAPVLESSMATARAGEMPRACRAKR